jgi:hypothetical protein
MRARANSPCDRSRSHSRSVSRSVNRSHSVSRSVNRSRSVSRSVSPLCFIILELFSQ